MSDDEKQELGSEPAVLAVKEVNMNYKQPNHAVYEELLKDLKNNQIGTLSLLGCEMERSIISELAQVLMDNISLARLSLSGTNIDDLRAVGLAGALAANRALIELDLSFNEIGDKGAQAFITALETNTKLTRLNLAGNNISEALMARLEALIHRNNRLVPPAVHAVVKGLWEAAGSGKGDAKIVDLNLVGLVAQFAGSFYPTDKAVGLVDRIHGVRYEINKMGTFFGRSVDNGRTAGGSAAQALVVADPGQVQEPEPKRQRRTSSL